MKLYISSDGPRPDKADEARAVEDVRTYILKSIDWPCEVKTNFQSTNQGCRIAVSRGISWLFESEERGIIIEDDCVASPSFFRFCDTLLEQYKDDQRIWHIGGTSTVTRATATWRESYYFSRYNHIWGWATWRRAWRHYDVNMRLYNPDIAHGIVTEVSNDRKVMKIWLMNFARVAAGMIDTWDYQWYFCVWVNNGLAVLPSVNLVSNVGFSQDATHTKDARNRLARLPCGELGEILHPECIVRNRKLDDLNASNLFRADVVDRIRHLWSALAAKGKLLVKADGAQ